MSSTTRRKVYRLLGDGYSQSRVAEALGLSRPTVSRHTKRLLKDGHIRKARGTTSPALYRRTSNPLPEDDIGDISLRSHHTSRLFKVIDRPNRPWPWFWDKTWNPSGKCEMSVVRDILMDTSEGPIKVRAIRYVQDRSLTIWLDEDHLETPEQVLAHQDVATEIAILVAKEIQSTTGLSLGLPEVMQPSHFAVDAPPDVWLDKSLGTMELETNNPDTAGVWLRLPEVIQKIEEDIEGLKSRQVEMVGLLEAMVSPLPQNDQISLQEVDTNVPTDFEIAYM